MTLLGENKETAKAKRQLANRGRLMYSIDTYKKGQASLGKTAELAGVSIGEMMDILAAIKFAARFTNFEEVEA